MWKEGPKAPAFYDHLFHNTHLYHEVGSLWWSDKRTVVIRGGLPPTLGLTGLLPGTLTHTAEGVGWGQEAMPLSSGRCPTCSLSLQASDLGPPEAGALPWPGPFHLSQRSCGVSGFDHCSRVGNELGGARSEGWDPVLWALLLLLISAPAAPGE